MHARVTAWTVRQSLAAWVLHIRGAKTRPLTSGAQSFDKRPLLSKSRSYKQ